MEAINGVDKRIEKHPFLAGLSLEFLTCFESAATIRRFASHQQIFHEGGEADHFYLITSGNVALETFVPGCGMVTIQSLGAGDALGWSWFFQPYRWHFTASTREPTEVISLDARVLREKAAENHEFHDELISRVANLLQQRLLGTRAQLIDLYGMRP